MRGIKAVLIMVFLVLTIFSGTFNFEDSEDITEKKSATIVDNLDQINEPERIGGGSRGGNLIGPYKPLIESNTHGGSWLDSFNDNSGIDWSLSDYPIIANGDLKFSHTTLKNGNFESGSLGSVPNNWKSTTKLEGIGSTSNALKLVNNRYYEGTKSTYFYARINCGSSPSGASWQNLTTSEYFNGVGASKVTFYISNITVQHSYSWGWNSYIRVLFIDSTQMTNVQCFWNGQGGSSNSYVSQGTGADGYTWYKYEINIPASIDKSYMKIGIAFAATSWVGQTGRYTLISGNVDNIYLDVNTGNTSKIFSKTITKPTGTKWDTLIFNHTPALNYSLNISLLNPSTNQQIPGTINYTANGEYDISSINPTTFAEVKLLANCTIQGNITNIIEKPIMHYWGVSWNTTNAWRDTFYGGLKGTLTGLTSADGECWQPSNITKLVKYSGNPILKDGPASSFDDTGVMYPTIVYDGTEYKMWYTGRVSSTWEIGLATSDDGITWTKYSGNPVLRKGTGNAWDSAAIGRPYVIFDGKTYRMWFQAKPSSGIFQIGYATSSNGINWQKNSNNPVLTLGLGSSWDAAHVFAPCVIYNGIQYKMWYTGSSSSNVHRIGYATSQDGINWIKYSGNPVLTGPTSANAGVADPVILPQANQYLGWYNNDYGSYGEIYFAQSNYGISWQKYASNPVIPRGSGGSWEANSVHGAEVILKDRQYYVYYSGYSGSIHQIGLAKSKVNTSGVLISEEISLLSSSNHEILVVNKTEPVGTFINVSILDAATSNPIAGFANIQKKIVNISGISRVSYPKIKLKANFESDGQATPILYDWSVGSNSPPVIIDVKSNLEVFRTKSVAIYINLSDGEEQESDLYINAEYKAPSDTLWQTIYLSTLSYNTDHWDCTFTPPINAELGMYLFKFYCNDSLGKAFTYPNPYYIEVKNNEPKILDFKTSTASTSLNRSTVVKLIMDCSDVETMESSLVIRVEYKSPLDLTWQTSYISNIVFASGSWEADFAPAIDADLGWYDIRVSCNDSDTEIYYQTKLRVVNNLPAIWRITNTPSGVTINRTKTVKISINCSDVECAKKDLLLIIQYKSPQDLVWQTSYLSSIVFNSGNWECDFTPPKDANLGWYDFNIICNDSDTEIIQAMNLNIVNNKPIIWSIKTDTGNFFINRTDTLKLIINCTDVEIATKDLGVAVKYKAQGELDWKDDFISNFIFKNGDWELDFTPFFDAKVGWYTFNITCNDSDIDVKQTLMIRVKNNHPIILDVYTSTGEFQLNRTKTLKITVDAFDIEHPEGDLVIGIMYMSPFDQSWQNEDLSSLIFTGTSWQTEFSPSYYADLGRYIFRIVCNDTDTEVYEYLNIFVLNNHPIIWEVKASDYEVKRTNSIKINVDASDIEIAKNLLSIRFRYKSPIDQYWQTNYFSTIMHTNGEWVVEFIPHKEADLGLYIINVTCNDSDMEVYKNIEIQVLNNLPTAPGIEIIPEEPKSTDNLEAMISKAIDIETPTNEIEYWLRWYRNNFYLPEFDNQTQIPYTETLKHDTWRCVAYSHDGDDLGPSDVAEVTILNSPPTVIEPFNRYEMFEDSIAVLEEKLMHVFSDIDGDELVFSVMGQDKIKVEIIQENGTVIFTPVADWYGSEYLTFSAHDKSSEAIETSVIVTVKPTNDLPEIIRVGGQNIPAGQPEMEYMVSQDEWLNLSIEVRDIDGDVERGMIRYFLNFTERQNLYFQEGENKIVFLPKNEDVGWHFINIRITDNNETPIIYISQNIKIQVLNVNDPPTVEISQPVRGKEYLDKDKISFDCLVEDPDLNIPNSDEQLTYRWYTNKSWIGDLGTTKGLSNMTLQPGFYTVIVEVMDNGQIVASDSVELRIKASPKKEESDEERTFVTGNLWWLVILIIIIIVVILVTGMVIYNQRKKKARELEARGIVEPVIQPTGIYQPQLTTVTATGPGTMLPHSLAVQTQPLPTAPIHEPPTQLPPVYAAAPLPAQPEIIAYEQQTGIDARLSPQKKLELLEERLLRGEIDQDIYLNLKAKYEMDAKPLQPPPQLPPASGAPTQGVPTPPMQVPQPTPQVQMHPQPQVQYGPVPIPPPQPITAPMPTIEPQPPQVSPPLETTIPTPIEPPMEPIISQIPPAVTEPPMPSDLPPGTYQPQQPPQQIQPLVQPPQQQYPQQPPQPQQQMQQPQQAPTQQLTTPCPLCQQQIPEYSNPCPYCGGELQWGG